MERVFSVRKSHYILSVGLPTIITFVLMIWMAFLSITQPNNTFTLSLLILTTIMFFDYVVALSHPEHIIVDEDKIIFKGLIKEHVYLINEIERINVRPVSYNRRIYVRINQAGLLKGRYWIHLDHIEAGSDLRKRLEAMVEEKHPTMKHMNRHSFTKTKK